MKELLLKNTTSLEKKRKIFSIREIKRQKGILARINKRYIYMIKNADDLKENPLAPKVNILKKLDSKKQTEEFFMKIKGSFYTNANEQAYLVFFCHTLHVQLNGQSTDMPLSQI